MENELKKATMLLKSLILHYHGLDEEEEEILNQVAEKINATKELVWANNFIAEDYMSAFERAKEYLKKTIGRTSQDSRLRQLLEVWEENHQKGYVTEMETTAMINLAKDWQIEKEFIKKINH